MSHTPPRLAARTGFPGQARRGLSQVPSSRHRGAGGEGAGLRWAGTRGERVPLSLLSSYSKRKDGLERGQCLTPSSGQRACAWQAASSVRTRTAGSDPGLETLGGRNLGSTVFLVTSAFQESKVVSPLSAGVCKQNAHLPVAPQTHSSQLQVGGSACGFHGSPRNSGDGCGGRVCRTERAADAAVCRGAGRRGAERWACPRGLSAWPHGLAMPSPRSELHLRSPGSGREV